MTLHLSVHFGWNSRGLAIPSSGLNQFMHSPVAVRHRGARVRAKRAKPRVANIMPPSSSSVRAFVAYRSVFTPGKTGRGRSVKYHLIDDAGEEVFAAYADESTPGDSHYTYKNAPGFTAHGAMMCHNRKALHEWLKEIVRVTSGRVVDGPITAQNVKMNSKRDDKRAQNAARRQAYAAAQAHAHTQGGVTVSTAKADGSARFVSYSQEKFTFPDGRRGVRFYVVDEAGVATLAVEGEERETRDGHYQYKRVDSFTAGAPLRCGNLSGVHKWLKDHIVGGQLVGVNFPYANANSSMKDKSTVSSTAALMRKKRGDIADGVSLIDPAVAVQTKVEEREAKWAIARRAALAYVREPTHPDHVADLEEITSTLKTVKTENKKSSKNVVEAVTAFRMLNSVYVSLHTLDCLEIKDVVLSLQKHPNETISDLAKQSVQRWLGALYSHIGTLASVYQRPLLQPVRHKVGYGPPKEAGQEDKAQSPPSLRHRGVTSGIEAPTAVVGTKRTADGLPSTPTVMKKQNISGLPVSTKTN